MGKFSEKLIYKLKKLLGEIRKQYFIPNFEYHFPCAEARPSNKVGIDEMNEVNGWDKSLTPVSIQALLPG